MWIPLRITSCVWCGDILFSLIVESRNRSGVRMFVEDTQVALPWPNTFHADTTNRTKVLMCDSISPTRTSSVTDIGRPGHRSTRDCELSTRSSHQRQVSFNSRSFQSGRRPRCPSLHPMRDPIGERSALLTISSFQRPRDTNEFDFQRFAARSNHRVAVRTDINKGKVRRQLIVTLCQSSGHITAFL